MCDRLFLCMCNDNRFRSQTLKETINSITHNENIITIQSDVLVYIYIDIIKWTTTAATAQHNPVESLLCGDIFIAVHFTSYI